MRRTPAKCLRQSGKSLHGRLALPRAQRGQGLRARPTVLPPRGSGGTASPAGRVPWLLGTLWESVRKWAWGLLERSGSRRIRSAADKAHRHGVRGGEQQLGWRLVGSPNPGSALQCGAQRRFGFRCPRPGTRRKIKAAAKRRSPQGGTPRPAAAQAALWSAALSRRFGLLFPAGSSQKPNPKRRCSPHSQPGTRPQTP
jgi:hypothetical protein